MSIRMKLAGYFASKVNDDEKAQLARRLLVMRLESVKNPFVDPSEIIGHGHLEHAEKCIGFFEEMEMLCEEWGWRTPSCTPGCDLYMDSLAHGGCDDCVMDEPVAPQGMTISPELWQGMKVHLQYMERIMLLTMTDEEDMHIHGA